MRVPVVEDEPQIADFIARGLSENGYSVDTAGDGDEAIQWSAVADFDVIILDVMLPSVDGIEVCTTLRERGVRIAKPEREVSLATTGPGGETGPRFFPSSGR